MLDYDGEAASYDATAAGPDGSARLCRDLAALPDQDRPRPQPRYRLLALERG
ncbi:hypothetical protein [Kitasatospora sp. NPDC007106]|uniref:hypothetical protein n=1 Tax=Kitasatospora sp. NPDC007106 TaxID=3156914 RepID=UPI0033F2EC66